MKRQNSSTALNWHYITVAMIFAVAIFIMVLYMPNLREIDSQILKTIRQFLLPFPQYIPLFINEIGKDYYIWPLVASVSVLVSHKHNLEAFMLILFTQLSFLVKECIKNYVCRERPCGDAYPGFSFPSGHSLVAMCFYGILIYLVTRYVHGFWRYLLISLFGLLIILAGLSRLWLGLHFPTDVLEGFLIGFIMVNLFIILDKFFSTKSE